MLLLTLMIQATTPPLLHDRIDNFATDELVGTIINVVEFLVCVYKCVCVCVCVQLARFRGNRLTVVIYRPWYY